MMFVYIYLFYKILFLHMLLFTLKQRIYVKRKKNFNFVVYTRVCKCKNYFKSTTSQMLLNIESSSLRMPSLICVFWGEGSSVMTQRIQLGVSRRKKNGIAISIVAKLWALRDGFHRCQNLHLSVVGIKLDAKSIVGLIENPNSSNNVVSPIVNDCVQLVSQLLCPPPPPGVVYFCESNKCVDDLTRMYTHLYK